MAPIIILNNPIPGIGSIEIYEPQMKDEQSILFFLKINHKFASIELKENGTWKTHGIRGRFPSKIVPLIQQEITEKYLGGL